MTAELARGQNHPLPHTRLEIRLTAGVPVLGCATLCDADGVLPGPEWVAHPGAPALPGIEVPRPAASALRFQVDLGALVDRVHLVHVVLALPEDPSGPTRFGATAAPYAEVIADGTAVASFTLTGLDAESAVVALELYRRQGVWKVRAVGQGYQGGLAALLGDQGLPDARGFAAGVQQAVARQRAEAGRGPLPGVGSVRPGADGAAPAGRPGPASRAAPTAGAISTPGAAPGSAPPPPTAPPAGADGSGGSVRYTHPGRRTSVPPTPGPAPQPAGPEPRPRPVAGDATGWSMDERLYNQVWGMFEDLARAVAGYRSTTGFAESRMDQELDRILSDPRNRLGGAGDGARRAARDGYEDLVRQAREVLDRDLGLLTAEAEVVEPALPPAYARWDSAVWRGYQVATEPPMALRLGDLHLPECPDLRIPMLVRLPLERGLWIDSGRAGSESALPHDASQLRRMAMDDAVAHAARLLAVHEPGEFTVHVIDPARSGGRGTAATDRFGCARRAARDRCAGRVGGSDTADRAGGPGADGGAGRRRRVTAAQPRHCRAVADHQRLPARLRRPRGDPVALSRR